MLLKPSKEIGGGKRKKKKSSHLLNKLTNTLLVWFII